MTLFSPTARLALFAFNAFPPADGIFPLPALIESRAAQTYDGTALATFIPAGDWREDSTTGILHNAEKHLKSVSDRFYNFDISVKRVFERLERLYSPRFYMEDGRLMVSYVKNADGKERKVRTKTRVRRFLTGIGFDPEIADIFAYSVESMINAPAESGYAFHIADTFEAIEFATQSESATKYHASHDLHGLTNVTQIMHSCQRHDNPSGFLDTDANPFEPYLGAVDFQIHYLTKDDVLAARALVSVSTFNGEHKRQHPRYFKVYADNRAAHDLFVSHLRHKLGAEKSKDFSDSCFYVLRDPDHHSSAVLAWSDASEYATAIGAPEGMLRLCNASASVHKVGIQNTTGRFTPCNESTFHGIAQRSAYCDCVKSKDSEYTCEECGDDIDEDECRTHGGLTYCESCFSDLFADCYDCHAECVKEDMTNHDHKWYCASCYNENFADCYECGETYEHGDLQEVYNRYNDPVHVCGYCRDNEYTQSTYSDEYFSDKSEFYTLKLPDNADSQCRKFDVYTISEFEIAAASAIHSLVLINHNKEEFLIPRRCVVQTSTHERIPCYDSAVVWTSDGWRYVTPDNALDGHDLHAGFYHDRRQDCLPGFTLSCVTVQLPEDMDSAPRDAETYWPAQLSEKQTVRTYVVPTWYRNESGTPSQFYIEASRIISAAKYYNHHDE